MPAVLPESCWVITDERHEIKSASDSWYKLWGFAEKDAIGKPVSIINRPGFSSPLTRRRYALEKSSHIRCTNVTKYGELISHDLTLKPHPDGILGTSKNIEHCISSPPLAHRGGRNAEYFGEEEEEEEPMQTQDIMTTRIPSGRDAEYFDDPGSDLPSTSFGLLPPGFQPDRMNRSTDHLARKATSQSDEAAPWSTPMKAPKLRWEPYARGRNSEYFDDADSLEDGTLTNEKTAAGTTPHNQRGRNAEYFEETSFGGGATKKVCKSGRDGEFDDVSLQSSPLFPPFFSMNTRAKSGRDGEFDSQDASPATNRAKSARDGEFDEYNTLSILPLPLAPPVMRTKSGRDDEF